MQRGGSFPFVVDWMGKEDGVYYVATLYMNSRFWQNLSNNVVRSENEHCPWKITWLKD